MLEMVLGAPWLSHPNNPKPGLLGTRGVGCPMALRDPSLVEQTVGSFDMGGVVQSSTVAKGLQRIYGDGEFHFITCSCHDRRPFLRFAHRREIFLQILEEVRQRYRFIIAGHV